jgi:anti-anti-sigma factor
MQITKRLSGETVALKVEGRLDGYWADHLAAAIDQEIRQGSHHIQLDLSQVAFLSSAGIGMLVRFYKDLKSIQGSFAVSNCSRNVLKVLELSKLVEVLVAEKLPEASVTNEARQSSTTEAPAPTTIRQIERSEAMYEIYPLAPESKLECRRLGDASLLERCGFAKEHCRTMQFSDSTFAIGLGAFGEHFEDCQGRFGEFIAAGGAVAYLPTDGTNVPDFLLAGGTALPEVQVCYGIACHGANPQPFSSLIRFEAKKSGEPVPLSLLLESCLDLSDAQQIGIVMIAESAGLIGAALRRSPVKAASVPNAFEFPRIRDWLSFTAEPAYTKSVVLSAGIAVRGSSADALAPVIRPFPNASSSGLPVSGHFHAATFSYRPVQRGQIDLKASIKTLFERQTLEGILHLLSDDRALSGGGQSELVRGACWIAPISNITAEGVQA